MEQRLDAVERSGRGSGADLDTCGVDAESVAFGTQGLVVDLAETDTLRARGGGGLELEPRASLQSA